MLEEPQDPEDLFKYAVKDPDSDNPNIRNKYYCCLCHKRFSGRTATRNHVESIHFAGLFNYKCNLCGKENVSKSALNYHITTVHNKK